MSGSVPPGPAAPRAAVAVAPGASTAARASSTEAASAAACVVFREGTAPDYPEAVPPASRLGGGARRGGLLDAARQQGLARDHEALDLRGALVELHDLRVAHQLLDGVVLDEAVAAVDLHGVRGDLHRGVRREALGVRGLERVAG